MLLYFGDYDDEGMQIPETALSDVEEWAAAEFVAYRVGLNGSEGLKQWETLSDAQAGTMITEALDQFVDRDKLREWDRRETIASEALNELISEHVDLGSIERGIEKLRQEWEAE